MLHFNFFFCGTLKSGSGSVSDSFACSYYPFLYWVPSSNLDRWSSVCKVSSRSTICVIRDEMVTRTDLFYCSEKMELSKSFSYFCYTHVNYKIISVIKYSIWLLKVAKLVWMNKDLQWGVCVCEYVCVCMCTCVRVKNVIFNPFYCGAVAWQKILLGPSVYTNFNCSALWVPACFPA